MDQLPNPVIEETESSKPTGSALANWIPNLLVFVGVALIVFAVAGFFLMNREPSNIPPGGIQPPRVGQSLSNFSLTSLDGKAVRLSDYAGHPVLVNTWATWCPPCRAEMPALEAFYQKHQGDGFVLLAINVGESKDLASQFVKEYGMSFPVLLDPDQKLADAMLIHDFPTSILVGKDGKVKSVHVGMFTADQLDTEMLPLLNQ